MFALKSSNLATLHFMKHWWQNLTSQTVKFSNVEISLKDNLLLNAKYQTQFQNTKKSISFWQVLIL